LAALTREQSLSFPARRDWIWIVVKGLRGWTAGLFAFLLAVALPSSAAAAAGDLDMTFSGNGRVITNVTNSYDWTLGLVLQDDGKIVTAGQAAGSGGRFYVVRYLNDGQRDTTFSADGVVFTNFTPGGDFGYDVALDNNGKIVVVGRIGGSGGRFGLARYNDDGTLDTTFSNDGKVETNFSGGNDYAFNVLVQADDKIVAVGRSGGRGGEFAIARYDDDGTLDTSFGGGDGKVTTNFTAGNDYADDVALVDADTIVVAGTANLGRDSKFALAQYDSTGARDATFGGDGRVMTNLSRGLDGAWGVAVQSGVGIVATGPAGGRVGLVRYNSAGALDPTFGGGDGIVKTNWTAGLDWSDEIALDAAGRLVIVGISNVFGNDPRYALGRYSANGAPGFTKLTNLTGGVDYGLDVQIETSTQKIVTTGAVRNGRQSFVARHLGS
jgi:uncharacterized delta-60 repeat protein